jgi:hypothetical protein
MDLHCSFCGKSQAEVERLIAGPLVFICNECVRLCAEILDHPTSQAPQVLIQLPDGSAHASEPTTPWRPLVAFGERLEWCTARSLVRGSTPLLVIAVRRRGAEGPVVGAAFGIHTKPTHEHAKEIALKYLLGRRS